VTWLPRTKLPLLRGRADRLGGTGDADFRADDFPALRSIHIDAAGRQHVVLKSRNSHVTVSIRGAAVAVAPACVTFEMRGLADLFAGQRNIALLQDLVEQGPASASAWSITGSEKRDALIALDAHCHGASHRDVALLIFGPEKVQAEWIADGCDLKDYVRRCRSRGVRYMQGGYRRLLR
jgi:hypothetical protein